LHSKFAISSTGYWDYARKLTGGCVQIQLWHGVGGGKKIGLDDKEHLNDVDIYQINLNISISKKTYFLGTSSSMKEVFHSAYKVPYQNFIKAGQPRNDLFLIKDFKPVTFNPIIFKGKKVIGYYPTHRNSGKLHIEVNKLFNLVEINAFCEKNGCIFVIKKHFYHRNEKEELEQYSNIIDLTSCNVDTNELLAFTDYLITDYSSISTDYLLLGRPIFYYCFDLEEYLKNDRKMYWKYESITPGPKCKNYNELIKALSNVIENNDDIYINKRREVCDFFFDHEYAQNKRACPIVYNFIKNYNKKSKRNVRKI
jgi:CDP-glycerol glycerophosphotransferase (TagB/SpsB family)